MKIAIIGVGNVGGALAKGFARIGHSVLLGTRDTGSEKITALISVSGNITAHSVSDAIAEAEVVLFSTPPEGAVAVAKENPSLKDKVVIDATNSLFNKPAPYKTAYEGIKKETGSEDVVKCFNSTGFENMENPVYNGTGIDMFTAGGSEKAIAIAAQLSKELGFAECYHFGGDETVELIEQFAMCWVNLAIFRNEGRGMAFKILKRS